MKDYFLGGEDRLSPSDAAVALIVIDGGRYLMQRRDQMPRIFYPGHWGVFGGAVEYGETPEEALDRELHEELGLPARDVSYFTQFTIDFGYGGLGTVVRRYYELKIAASVLDCLVLGEGSEMRAFTAPELLGMSRVVPYDLLAVWMHATRDAVSFTTPRNP